MISSGKDSLYSMFLSMREGHEIRYIISFVSENPDSYMFHTPNIDLVKEQARLLNIRHVEIQTKGEKEKELDDIENALKSMILDLDGVVTGAVQSNYQKSRIDAICDRLGIKSLAPLWQKDPVQTLRDMINDGFEIIITAVAAPPLDETWLGRKIDSDCIYDLIRLNKQYGIHILGEGGEYESLVLDCPMFSKRMKMLDAEKMWNKKLKHGILNINKIILKEK